MAGLIKREDIDEVRSRTDIREIVEGYVTLKSAGIGSYKGLCPFHDERTPSFHVRPQYGTYHCFGCDESGDVIAFVQAMEHTTFAETVERLAARIGYELHYEQGSGPDKACCSSKRMTALTPSSSSADSCSSSQSSADSWDGKVTAGPSALDWASFVRGSNQNVTGPPACESAMFAPPGAPFAP